MDLYQRYFVDRGAERLSLFEVVRDTFEIESALYLGSFAHLTPALVFPVTVLVDNDKRMRALIDDAANIEHFVATHRRYPDLPSLTVLQRDYQDDLPLPLESFDLLISQYAGFVSVVGLRYLKPGGYLLVNDSHGDATIASMNSNVQLVGVLDEFQGHWTLSRDELDTYFLPKSGHCVERTEVIASMKGPTFRRSAGNYLFRKIG